MTIVAQHESRWYCNNQMPAHTLFSIKFRTTRQRNWVILLILLAVIATLLVFAILDFQEDYGLSIGGLQTWWHNTDALKRAHDFLSHFDLVNTNISPWFLLFIISLTYNSFGPLRPELYLVPLVSKYPELSIPLLIAAVFGAYTGNLLAYGFGRLTGKIGSHERTFMDNRSVLEKKFKKYGGYLYIPATFGILPYKLLSYIAGILGYGIKNLSLWVISTRTFRYGTITLLAIQYHAQILHWMATYSIVPQLLTIISLLTFFSFIALSLGRRGMQKLKEKLS